MFTTVSPQQVQHSSGYIVQVSDRFHVEYIEGGHCATVEVEFAASVGIFRDSLQINCPMEVAPAIIFERIIAGLEAMGCAVEIC